MIIDETQNETARRATAVWRLDGARGTFDSGKQRIEEISGHHELTSGSCAPDNLTRHLIA